MAPSTYPTRTYTTIRSLTYSYMHIQPTSPSNPSILFLHGFPSSSHDWHHQIAYFETLGYGIIAPDLLGYGGTSKPPFMDFYKFKDMASDLEEILSLHSISPIRKVMGVGHDWGSLMLLKLVNYYPELFEKLAFLDVCYLPPNGPAFDFQTLESVISICCSPDDDTEIEYMGATGGFRKWPDGSTVASYPDFFIGEDVECSKSFSSLQNGGFGAANNWYTTQLYGINEADDKAIPAEKIIIHQPTLLITSDAFVNSGVDFSSQMSPYVPDLKVVHWNCSHWIQLQKSQETNLLLREFFKGSGEISCHDTRAHLQSNFKTLIIPYHHPYHWSISNISLNFSFQISLHCDLPPHA
ncbi:hypothetical protein EYC80_007831 [Monilinia laxa]|uniref:AB hydrolase-1 domain-containing protein n=1 Tax=Monilinia laxa TaxID=61186 RepID=A0A5N6JUH7_MONLA|nr:hypothetical protein EYC80_007831 [Monilinia laxa]